MKAKINFFSLLFIFLTAMPIQVPAQVNFGGESHTKLKLIPEVTSVQPGGSFWVAARLSMEEGWHIYWRNPGDTGLETEIVWDLPAGFTAGELHWPYPEKIIEEPLVVYGFHDVIYLLTRIDVDKSVKPGSSVQIKAKANFLECAEVCIPGESADAISLPVKAEPPQPDIRWVEVFSEARSKLPLESKDWQVSAQKDGNSLLIQFNPPQWFTFPFEKVAFFPYTMGIIDNIAQQEVKKKDGSYLLRIKLAENAKIPAEIEGIVVNEEGWRGPGSEKAMEIKAIMGEALAPAASNGNQLGSIWLAILFSFLGGIILNLMPCVLPVLSIKIMGIINQAHDEHTQPWKHGLVFTMGVLVSFLALAGILLILKAGGAQLGWGFQLQEPFFLTFLAAFMFVFGLSMFGVFEIGTSFTTVEGKIQPRSSGFVSSFVSGILATIVATPCTAPFMGSALGFALAQPAWVSLVVFTFLGLGMAFPFMLISSIPALLKYIPKPGRWMESLKQFMGFLLVATVIWLLWVLGIQSGANVVIIVLFDLLITAVAAWIYGRWGNLAMPPKTRRIAIALAVILVLGSNGYVFSNIDKYAVTPQAAAVHSEGLDWREFTQEQVDELVAAGQPVFIDFTAAWCLSCQVNDQVAFSSEEVQQKFKEKKVAAFKADWTSRDEKIAQALAKFGRHSVPLYVLYPGGQSNEPVLLPEIITPGIILQALELIK